MGLNRSKRENTSPGRCVTGNRRHRSSDRQTIPQKLNATSDAHSVKLRDNVIKISGSGLAEEERRVLSWNGTSHSISRTDCCNLGGSMYVSKLATGRLLAVALAIILWGWGIPVQQAKAEKKNHTSQEMQKGCQTCPVDPKVIAKQKKEEEHAQHEAAEACQRRQKEIAHAQHEAEEAQARAAEKQQEVAELGGGMCTSTEAASEEKTQPEPDMLRAKPTPEPAPAVEAPAPAPVVEPPPAPAVEPTP